MNQISTTTKRRRKGASIRPSDFVSGREWRRELKEYGRVDKAVVHRGVDSFPAYTRRSLKLYALGSGRELGEATAFVASRGADIMLADPLVDIFRDSIQPILDHGTPEEQDWLENFRDDLGGVYTVTCEDGKHRLDIHMSEAEWGPLKKLMDLLGLQQQTVLALACMHVLREVPAVRRDWRRRMVAECQRYHEVLGARARRAKGLAAQCRRRS